MPDLTREEVERQLDKLNSRVWPDGQLQVVELMSGQYQDLLQTAQSLYVRNAELEERVRVAERERDDYSAENRLLRSTLKQWEWQTVEDHYHSSELGITYCPACGQLERDGHKDDCWMLRALAASHTTAEVERVKRLEAVLEAAKALIDARGAHIEGSVPLKNAINRCKECRGRQ